MLRMPNVLLVILVDMQFIEAAGLVAVVRWYVLRGGMEFVIAVLGAVISALIGIFVTIDTLC